MHTLILARHAKSSWKFPDLDDHQRPLNKRGMRDAPLMAAILAEREPAIQIVYTSTAVRALSFAELIGEQAEVAVVPDESLYTFSVSSLLQAIAGLDDDHKIAVVVGHNPAITAAANYLAGESIDNVPTSGLVSLAANISSWTDFAPENCTIKFFDYPKKKR